MIFINSAIRQMGENPLIINYKAKQFFKGPKLGREDFDRFFTIFAESGNVPRFNIQEKNNMILAICYFDIDYNQNALNYYNLNFKEDIYEKVKGGQQKVILYYLFNLIEFEIKTRTRSSQELKIFYNSLNKLSQIQKTIEEYLLMNYYLGVIKYLLKEYDNALMATMNITVDIEEQIQKNQLSSSDLIKYIEIRNILLRIKIYQGLNQKDSKTEIISNIESLFELCKGEKEDIAISLGIQLNEYQNSGFECTNCIKTLLELNNILHKEMLYGRSHTNIINEFIYISALLGYYYSLIEDFEQVKRFSNKIDKNIAFLREFAQMDNKNSTKDLPEFEFINILLKGLSKSYKNNYLSEGQNEHLINYQKLLGDKIKGMDNIILNLYILTNGKDNNIKELYKTKDNYYYSLLSKQKMLDWTNILTCYLFLYNHLSDLSQSALNAKSKSFNKEIRNYSKAIIDYTNSSISKNASLRNIFQLAYFKDIFNRIYFSFIYSFYCLGDYEGAIKEFNNYNDLVKIQFELNTNHKSFVDILKIKGDCYFKLNQFADAIQIYKSIIPLNSDNGLIKFNLALCYIFMNDKKNAIEQLNNAMNYYTERKKDKQISTIKSILKTLN